jgi:hypothetical protein
MKRFWLLLCLLILSGYLQSQELLKEDSLLQQGKAFLQELESKRQKVEALVSKSTEKYLQKIDRQEQRLRRMLGRKDSLSRAILDVANRPAQLLAQLRNKADSLGLNGQDYFGRLDSIQTSLRFLEKLNGNPLQDKLQEGLARFDGMKQQLDAAFQVERLIQQRKSQITEQLTKLGMVRELRKYRSVVNRYSQEIRSIKQELAYPDKLISRSLSYLSRLPAFDKFFRKHSQYASMFRMPGGVEPGDATPGLEGLQTRQDMEQMLQRKQIGGMQPGGGGMQNGLGQVQQQWNDIKGKLEKLRQREVEDIDITRYKPVQGRRKTMWDHFELGANMQTVRSRGILPVTSDIALSLGYKLGKFGTAGVGVAYKMGWGDNINKIRITHQGLGLRSFVDMKIRGSLFVTGGAEMNYLSAFDRVDQLRVFSAWQSSGLLGVTKKLQMTKKMKGNVQLLWDFLSYQQIPRGQPFVFRVGYMIR